MAIKTIPEIIEEISPHYASRKKKADAKTIQQSAECEHQIVYDSPADALEPLYFWILDFMNDLGMTTEKLVDTFTSTPGGTHFSEVGMKATRLQEDASKMFANIGVVTKGILNNIYDLKDFKIRLEHYNGLNSKDKNTQEASRLALKQVWMDRVDIARGNSSIKAMALGQMGFTGLIDAFLIVKDEKMEGPGGKEIDLNDRMKRMLKSRIQEFNIWLKESEATLRQRYKMQKTYLKSQVNNLKLYSRWLKPYLRAAQQLSMKEPGREPSLVNVFNTVRMELTLFAKQKMKAQDLAVAGDLPKDFKKIKVKRDYYACVLIDFKFRAIPQQGRFTGRTEITFKGYGLNQDELDKLDVELEKSDVGDVLALMEGSTTESIGVLQDQIDEFMEEEEKEKTEETSKSTNDTNPFLALIGHYDKKPKKDKEKSSESSKKKSMDGPIRKDDWVEKNHLRKYVAEEAEAKSFLVFDIYKKAHQMASWT